MTDEEIISRIEWNRTVAPNARISERIDLGLDIQGQKITAKVDKRVAKWTISGNLPPLKKGDLPIGESRTFKFDATTAHIQAATRGIQKRIVASYRLHNETPKVETPVSALEVDLQSFIDNWTPKDLI